MHALDIFGRTGNENPPRREVALLDPLTINQIAAGEVIERPASVVKELVENAIDAGARRIRVHLEDAGVSQITVSDNGHGMTAENAIAALQRHATSKIRSADDLLHVVSLGYRGEAIPSIASVSRFTLTTGTGDGLRHQIVVEAGEITASQPVSGPEGTEIRVEDLFFNVPARLKFLKSRSTELGQCVDVLTRYAMAYPHVAFHVTHGPQEAILTDGSGDLAHAIGAIWGRELVGALAPVDATIAGIRVHGYVSPPHLTKPTRAMQITYVNGRPVRSRTLMASLDQAYRMLTPEKRYPIVVLMLELEPSRVDINVSPTKSDVRFEHEGAAFDAVRYAIKEALLACGMMPTAVDIAQVNEALQANVAQMGMPVPFGSTGIEVIDTRFASMANPPWHDAGSKGQTPTSEESPLDPATLNHPESSAYTPGVSSSRYPFADLLDGLKVIGQAMNTFIIAENRRGLVIIDQHVAHERVIYEYLCGLKGPTAIEIQRLLVPETLHLDRRSAILLEERIETIRELGFDIESFGQDAYVVRSAPAALRGKSPAKLLQDLVDELVDGSVTRKLAPTREQIWIMSSCKMAVKAGDPLSMTEMEKLIADLAQTENPYLCPHGRPITMTLGVEDILKKFYRT